MVRPMTDIGHLHVAVFYGPRRSFCPGLVVFPSAPGLWEVSDQTGQIGAPGTAYGTWPSEREACREALRLLREKFGEGTLPCWGDAALNRALTELGCMRGRVRWRWWPPGLTVTGAVPVGPDGTPN